ncbi:unnamed protein product [Didymodactylos carnosus]|uniref:Uncharacterized protein n=1 Tax=Didymodactylos carnosus TaxID=1234261 RepID=A0A8S2PUN4_9BILA|nr:unnamed protein product [Didymodactylos carnosus]
MDKNRYSETTTDVGSNDINELVQIVESHISPTTKNTTLDYRVTSSPLFTHSDLQSDATRYTPVMGTSVARQRRRDQQRNDSVENNTNINDSVTQPNYQNLRQILDHSPSPPNTTTSYGIDSIVDANMINPPTKQTFNSKREYFEQRSKYDNYKAPKYDSPSRIISSPTNKQNMTTITTANINTDRQSSSSNESPSVDKVLEQAAELKSVEAKRYKTEDGEIVESVGPSAIIERTEEYQIYIDEKGNQIGRTPVTQKTTVIRSGHATDLDQAAAISRQLPGQLNDDHQAIQNLTRAIQDRQRPTGGIVSTTTTTTTISSSTETSKEPEQQIIRLPLTNNNSSLEKKTSISNVIPIPNILNDKTNLLATVNEYTVIDALLNNPLAIIDQQREKTNFFNNRIHEIETNLRNPDYVAALKQSQTTKGKPKKTKKEPKKKEEKVDKRKSSKNSKEKPTDEFETGLSTTPIISAPVNIRKTYHTLPGHTSTSPTRTDTNFTSLPTTTSPSVYDDKRVTAISATLISPPPPVIDLPAGISVDDKAPLLDPKEKKKRDKEEKKRQKDAEKAEKNKKKLAEKQKKSKKLTIKDQKDYRAIDAVINDPINSYLPDSYVIKQVPTITDHSGAGITLQPGEKYKGETVDSLVKIVNDIFLHSAAALVASSSSPTTTKTPSRTIRSELVHKNPLLTQTGDQTQNYRYVDERGIPIRGYDYKTSSYKDDIRYVDQQARPDAQYIRYIDDQGTSPVGYRTSVTEVVRQQPVLSHIGDDNQYIRYIDEQGRPVKQYSSRNTSIETSPREISRQQPQVSSTGDYIQYINDGRPVQDYQPVSNAALPYSYEYNARNDESSYQNERPKNTSKISSPYFDNRTEQRKIINDYIDDRDRRSIPQVEEKRWEGEKKVPTTTKREDIELLDKRIPQYSEQRNISIPIERESKQGSRRSQEQIQPNNNIKLAWLPLNHAEQIPTGYETDSTISERSFPPQHIPIIPSARQTYTRTHYQPPPYVESSRYIDPYYRRSYTTRPIDYYDSYYARPAYGVHRGGASYHGRGISPEYGTSTRNYNLIEVFRGGDTRPSEVYSVPLSDSLMVPPPVSSSTNNNRSSRYDQYHKGKYSPTDRPYTEGNAYYSSTLPSSSTTNNIRYTTLPISRYQSHIPTQYSDYSDRYGSSYSPSHPVEQHHSPSRRPYYDREGYITPLYTPTYKQQQYQRYPVDNNNHIENYLRQSKSATFDYRPLRSKLQREHKITPSLLVDEKWDQQHVEQEPFRYRPSNINNTNDNNKYYTTDQSLSDKTQTLNNQNIYRRSADDENIQYRSQRHQQSTQNRDQSMSSPDDVFSNTPLSSTVGGKHFVSNIGSHEETITNKNINMNSSTNVHPKDYHQYTVETTLPTSRNNTSSLPMTSPTVK